MRVVALLVAAGCSSGPAWGKIDTGTAQSMTGKVASVVTAQQRGSASDVSNNLDLLVAESQQLVQPDNTIPGMQGQYLGALGNATGTATCDASGCRFDHFGGSNMGETWQTSGTVTASEAAVALALTHDFDGPIGAMTWTIDGTLTSRDNRIGGHVHSHGSDVGQVAAPGVTWDIVVDFGPAVLDDTGCAIGGSIHATTSYDDPDRQGCQPSYDLQADFTFSPPCSVMTEP